jgi:hypothetical protein
MEGRVGSWGQGHTADTTLHLLTRRLAWFVPPSLPPSLPRPLPRTRARVGRRHLGITAFVAKISEANAPSIELFTQKLGFVEVKRVAAFEEVHLARLAPAPLADSSSAAGGGAGGGLAYAEESVTHTYQPALPSSKR